MFDLFLFFMICFVIWKYIHPFTIQQPLKHPQSADVKKNMYLERYSCRVFILLHLNIHLHTVKHVVIYIIMLLCQSSHVGILSNLTHHALSPCSFVPHHPSLLQINASTISILSHVFVAFIECLASRGCCVCWMRHGLLVTTGVSPVQSSQFIFKGNLQNLSPTYSQSSFQWLAYSLDYYFTLLLQGASHSIHLLYLPSVYPSLYSVCFTNIDLTLSISFHGVSNTQKYKYHIIQQMSKNILVLTYKVCYIRL